jgi:hypothetical protein
MFLWSIVGRELLIPGLQQHVQLSSIGLWILIVKPRYQLWLWQGLL